MGGFKVYVTVDWKGEAGVDFLRQNRAFMQFSGGFELVEKLF